MNINEINEAFDREYEIHSKDPVYRIIRACGSSTANSDINVFALERIIEDIRATEREQCAKDRCDAEEEARRNERCIKEMEQPVPKQSGVMSITVSKVCEADALPPTSNAVYWMDMVVVNLVRNGVNKHRARELAYHFYTYTTPRENNNG